MYRPSFILIMALALGGQLMAEPVEKAEKPLGRTQYQRFGPIDQGLVFNPNQGSADMGRTFHADQARTKTFQFNQKVAPSKFDAKTYGGTKTSSAVERQFATKDANTQGKYQVPNADQSVATKTKEVKEARDADKSAATRMASDANRPYLGPEKKNLDRAIDPNKPRPGWVGDRLEVLTLEQIRELLNKNK